MADRDPHTPDEPTQDAVPNPHRGEPAPAPDAHTRPSAEDVVRPDQQEELGPLEGLAHASAVAATAEVTDDPEAKAEAERLGVEGEGVEAAQIFGVMVATAVTLAVAVFGVFWLVAIAADDEAVERDATALYPELADVERVSAEMENYSRTDSLYRIPIGDAMQQVATAYAVQQGGGAVPAPDNFNTIYVDSEAEDRLGFGQTTPVMPSATAGTLPTQEPDVEMIDTPAPEPVVDEPEDR